MTVRRSIREIVLKMESTLLTLTVQTRNHSKFIVTTNTPSSKEEWMDPRISLEVGQTMFRALVQSGVSSAWLGLEKIHCLTTRTARNEVRIDMADFRGDKKYPYYNLGTHQQWWGMLLVSTSYRLEAIQQYCQRQY